MRVWNHRDVVAGRARRGVGRVAGLAVEALESRRLLTAFWTGAAGNNWSDSGNWQGGITPQSDGVVDFPANAANKTSVNDLGATNLIKLTIHGNGYNISNSAPASVITFSGDGIVTLDAPAGSTNTFNAAVHLNNTGTAVNVAADSTLNFGAAVDGSGTLNKNGTGKLVLPSANPNFNGPFNVNAGTVRVENPGALGTTSGDTSVTNVSTLELAAGADEGGEVLHIGGTGFNNAGALRADGTLDWNGAVDLNRLGTSIVVNTGFVLTLHQGIVGGDSIVKQGAGTLAIAGGSSSFGGGEVQAGVLDFQDDASTGAFTVSAGAQISLESNVTVTASGSTILNGTGPANNGALNNVSGSNRWNGNLKAGSNTQIFTTAGTLTVSGSIDTNGFTVTGGGSGTMEFSGAITGGGGLAKSGTGTLILSGTAANTYTGATTVNAGILSARKSTALGGATAGTTVAAGATLALQGGVNIAAEPLTVTGAGGGTGALVNTSGNNTWGGDVALAGPATIGSAAGTLTISGDVNNAGSLLTVTGAGNVVLSGAVTGSGGLTKTGTGTLTLGGTAGNTYAGTTNINTGIVILAKPTGLGATSGTTIVASGGALQFDGAGTVAERLSISGNGIGGSTPTSSGALDVIGPDVTLTGGVTVASAASIGCSSGDMVLAGVLDGAGTLSKIGGGNLTLSGNNANFSGRLLVVQGDLTAIGANALGVPGSGNVSSTLVQIGAGLSFGPSGAGGNVTVNEALTLAGTLSGFSAANSTSTWAGPVTLSAPATLSPIISAPGGATGRYTISGVVSGTENLVKAGPGTVTLAGTSANIFIGTVTVQEGTLALGKTAGLNAITGDLIIGDDAGTDALTLLANNQIADASAVTVNSSGTLDLSNHDDAIGALTLVGGSVATGTGTLTLGGDLTATSANVVAVTPARVSGNLDIGAGPTRTFNVNPGPGGRELVVSADITGAGTLVKAGTGVMELSGAAAPTLNTSVTAGTLLVTGSAGNVTVGAATLGGNGNVGRLTVNGQGVVSPSSTIATGGLTANGNVVFNDGSAFSVDLNGPTAGGSYDQLRVIGTVDVGGSTLTARMLQGLVPPPGFSFVVIDNDGADPVAGTFNGLPEGAVIVLNNAVVLRVSYVGGDGNDVTLTVPGAPPPPAPTVVGVFVNGTAWQAAFRDALPGNTPGASSLGFVVPSGAGQLLTLPWSAINQISIRFDQAVSVQQADLQVRGVNRASYAFSAFAFDAASRTATWTLADVPVNDKLLLDLDADSPDGVRATAGGGPFLDGEWTNGSDAFPSGNGAAGGDFKFRLNVLAGDATRNAVINALDLGDLKSRLNRTAANPGSGTGAYSVFADITGDGRINSLDLAGVKVRLNQRLPVLDPAFLLD